MIFFVYILQSKTTNKYYVGSSLNPEKRCDEHNRGVTVSTRNKGPWELKYKQAFESKSTALKIEKKLKSFKSKIVFEKIINSGTITIKLAGE